MSHVGMQENFSLKTRVLIESNTFARELRPIGKTLNINAHTPSVDTIRELSVNCTGTKVTVLTFQVIGKKK